MNTSTLQLGHSELIYLLWLMKTLSLPGIGTKPLGNKSNEQLIADLAHAKVSLQERGLIDVEASDIKINDQVILLIGTCALAKASLLLESQSKDCAAQFLSYYYHATEWVRHSILETGAHNFSRVESPLPDFFNMISQVLPQDCAEVHSEFTLPKIVVDRVLALFSKQQLPEVYNVFQNAGLPDDMARVLSDTLGDLQQKIFIGVTYHNGIDDQMGESALLIRNTQGFWHVCSVDGNGSVKLTSVSPHEILSLFSHIVGQAQIL